MEHTGGAIIESVNGGGYPFADLCRLRTDAGAFMRHVLSDDEDEGMEDDTQHLITPDYPCFMSSLPPHDAKDPIADRSEESALNQGIFPGEPSKEKDNPSSVAVGAAWNSFFRRQPITTTAHPSHVEVRIIPSSKEHYQTGHPMTSTSKVDPLRQRTSPLKKSRSIQIKRTRRGSDEVSSSSAASAEQMYDWATWRMYQRITTARRNKFSVNPLPAGSVSHQDMVHASNSRAYRGVSGFPREGGHLSVRDTDVSPQKGSLASAEKSDFDEGVFVMDL